MHVLHVRAAGRRPRELVEELVDVGEEQQVGIEVDDLVILVQTKDVQLGKGGVEPRPVLQLAFISVFYVVDVLDAPACLLQPRRHVLLHKGEGM